MLYYTTCRWAAGRVPNKKKNSIQTFICGMSTLGSNHFGTVLLFKKGKGLVLHPDAEKKAKPARKNVWVSILSFLFYRQEKAMVLTRADRKKRREERQTQPSDRPEQHPTEEAAPDDADSEEADSEEAEERQRQPSDRPEQHPTEEAAPEEADSDTSNPWEEARNVTVYLSEHCSEAEEKSEPDDYDPEFDSEMGEEEEENSEPDDNEMGEEQAEQQETEDGEDEERQAEQQDQINRGMSSTYMRLDSDEEIRDDVSTTSSTSIISADSEDVVQPDFSDGSSWDENEDPELEEEIEESAEGENEEEDDVENEEENIPRRRRRIFTAEEKEARKKANAEKKLETERLRELATAGWELDFEKFPRTDVPYPNLYNGSYGPVPTLLAKADSPLDLFFYFLPAKLWKTIAIQSNLYRNQQMKSRVLQIQRRQKKLRLRIRSTRVEKKIDIRNKLKVHPDILAIELVKFIGLLIARVLCPHKRRLSYHWSLVENGAIPKGTFGKYMPRNRFDYICRNLHFTNNNAPEANEDRAWKIRSVVTTLQKTFRKGYQLPPVLSFDEGMLPSRSPFNKTRVFMKDKPHKWGTKMFMTCCATTAYCIR
jgi:hypothetical protein